MLAGATVLQAYKKSGTEGHQIISPGFIQMKLIGYTLGNPTVYDPELAKGPLYKAVGGAFFKTKIEAESALDTSPLGHKNLPAIWFPDVELPIPGKVYELHSDMKATGEVDQFRTPDGVGARVLRTSARIWPIP